jgi:hypothetical protein
MQRPALLAFVQVQQPERQITVARVPPKQVFAYSGGLVHLYYILYNISIYSNILAILTVGLCRGCVKYAFGFGDSEAGAKSPTPIQAGEG